MHRFLATMLATLACMHAAGAAELRVLSAGAVEPGLRNFAAVAKRDTGHDLVIQFNTAPQIAKRLAAGETFDILIAPPATMALAQNDQRIVADTRIAVGRVGAGIIVRAGNPLPSVTDVNALKEAVTKADRVVYNTASTGLYPDRLFQQLGVLEAIKPKTTRYPDGASVMEHIIKGQGNEIGFGAITEIRMYQPKGLSYVGPLPDSVQNYTSYDAAVMTGAKEAEAARTVLKAMKSQAGMSAFVNGGVE